MKLTRYILFLLLITGLLFALLSVNRPYSGDDQWAQIISTTAIRGTSTQATALRVAPSGKVHIAYVSGAPEYNIRYTEIGTNLDERIGSAGDQQRTEITLSLALKPSGEPGVAYVDDRFGHLVYAEREGARWVSEIVDAANQVGYFPSLAYDKHGEPYISYFDNANNDIKFATHAGNGWRIETIDASGEPGFHIPAGFTQLVLGCASRSTDCTSIQPHVVYLRYRFKPYDGELRYATRLGPFWHIETIDNAKGAGGFPSLALDQAGHPWVSYYRAGTWDYQSGELRVAHHDGMFWKVEVIDGHGNAGRYSALAVRPNGRPVIAYYASESHDLRLAWRDDSWHTATLIAAGTSGAWVTLAVDNVGTLYLTYADVREASHVMHW